MCILLVMLILFVNSPGAAVVPMTPEQCRGLPYVDPDASLTSKCRPLARDHLIQRSVHDLDEHRGMPSMLSSDSAPGVVYWNHGPFLGDHLSQHAL
jgi:hypothetical protein